MADKTNVDKYIDLRNGLHAHRRRRGNKFYDPNDPEEAEILNAMEKLWREMPLYENEKLVELGQAI